MSRPRRAATYVTGTFVVCLLLVFGNVLSASAAVIYFDATLSKNVWVNAGSQYISKTSAIAGDYIGTRVEVRSGGTTATAIGGVTLTHSLKFTNPGCRWTASPHSGKLPIQCSVG